MHVRNIPANGALSILARDSTSFDLFTKNIEKLDGKFGI